MFRILAASGFSAGETNDKRLEPVPALFGKAVDFRPGAFILSLERSFVVVPGSQAHQNGHDARLDNASLHLMRIVAGDVQHRQSRSIRCSIYTPHDFM